jgi:acyl carrier protein
MTNPEKLKQAFIAALNVKPGGDFESLAYAETPGWDSVAHMALVSEIESAFDVMLATDDVIDLSSFIRAKAILATHGVAFS